MTTETLLEYPVLGFEVFDERFLLPGKPRSEHDDQELHQGLPLDHTASLHQAVASRSLNLGRISGPQERHPAGSPFLRINLRLRSHRHRSSRGTPGDNNGPYGAFHSNPSGSPRNNPCTRMNPTSYT